MGDRGIPTRREGVGRGVRDVEELRAHADRGGPTGRVAGIDVDATRVEDAREALRGDGTHRIAVARGSALDVPYDDASFDLVFCKGVLHEVRRVDAAAAEMARVCRSGGAVWLMDISRIPRVRFEAYRWRSWLRGRRTGDIWPGFTRRRIERAAREADLSVERYELLPTTWRLGTIQVQPFLLRAVRRSAVP